LPRPDACSLRSTLSRRSAGISLSLSRFPPAALPAGRCAAILAPTAAGSALGGCERT
jgi:hypothetical protein